MESRGDFRTLWDRHKNSVDEKVGQMTKIDKLIARHRNKIASLDKRVKITLTQIQTAEEKFEERIETTLGAKYRKLAEERASYGIGLDHLLLGKEGERRAKK